MEVSFADYSEYFKLNMLLPHSVISLLKKLKRQQRTEFISWCIRKGLASATGQELVQSYLSTQDLAFGGFGSSLALAEQQPTFAYYLKVNRDVLMRDFLLAHDMRETRNNRTRAAMILRANGFEYDAVAKHWRRRELLNQPQFDAAME